MLQGVRMFHNEGFNERHASRGGRRRRRGAGAIDLILCHMAVGKSNRFGTTPRSACGAAGVDGVASIVASQDIGAFV